MVLPIAIFISGILLFCVPHTTVERKKINLKDEKSLGYPYKYHRDDILYPIDIELRIRFIRIWTIVTGGELVKLLGAQPIVQIGVPFHSSNYTQIEQIQVNKSNFSLKNILKFADFYDQNSTKITLSEKEIEKIDFILNEYLSGKVTKQQSYEMLSLRGGESAWEGARNVICIVILGYIFESYLSNDGGSAAGWGVGLTGGIHPRSNTNNQRQIFKPDQSESKSKLYVQKPDSISREQWSQLTKAQKRQVADPKGRDYQYMNQGFPTLTFMFNQVKHKVPGHGGAHGLPVNEKGRASKSDENAMIMRDDLINQVKNTSPNEWYLNGQYQGGTERGCQSINVYNPDDGRVVVFQKFPDGTNSYLTDCIMTPREQDHFEKTDGNFLTEAMLDELETTRSLELENVSPIEPSSENVSPINPSFENSPPES